MDTSYTWYFEVQLPVSTGRVMLLTASNSFTSSIVSCALKASYIMNKE